MATYLLHIAAGFGLSFIGSLPIGMINMTVAESTIRKGLKSGLMIAAGASLIELIQALLSVKFTSLFTGSPFTAQLIQWGSVVVFIGLGLYFLLAKVKTQRAIDSKQASNHSDFYKGMLVSALNVLVFPYWIFYGTYLSANGWLTDNSSLIFFVLGVMAGTFFLLYLYAALSLKILPSITKIVRHTNRILAGLFFFFALIQLVRIIANQS